MARLAVRVPCDRTVGDVIAAVVEVASGLPEDVFGLLTGAGRSVRWRRLLDIDSESTAHARAVIAASQEAVGAALQTAEITHDDRTARTTVAVDLPARSWRVSGEYRHRSIEAPFDVQAMPDAGGWRVAGSDWHGVIKPIRHGARVESLAVDGRDVDLGTIEVQRHGTDRVIVRVRNLELSDRFRLRALHVTVSFGPQEMRVKARGRFGVRGAGRLAVLAWPFGRWWARRKIADALAKVSSAITSHERWPEVVGVADAVLGTRRTVAVMPTAKPLPGPTLAKPSPQQMVARPSARPMPSRRLLLGLAPVALIVGMVPPAALAWFGGSPAQLAPPAVAASTACEPDDVVADLDLAWDDPGCLRMQAEAFHRRVEGPNSLPVPSFGWRIDTHAVQLGGTQWMPWGAGPSADLCFTSDAGDGSLERGDVVDCFGPGVLTVSCPSDPATTPSVFAEQCSGHAGLTAYYATRRTLLEDDRGQREEGPRRLVPTIVGLTTAFFVSGFLLVRGLRTRAAE